MEQASDVEGVSVTIAKLSENPDGIALSLPIVPVNGLVLTAGIGLVISSISMIIYWTCN